MNQTLDFEEQEMCEKIKAKLENEKEKKECEETIKIMKNYISAMKRQKKEMDKKLVYLKNKENNINNAKKEKENIKKVLNECNINRKTELEKKKYIEKQR